LLDRYVYDDADVLEEARILHGKYKKQEQLVVLELTLWKAACILHPPENAKHVLALYQFFSGDWKAKKEAMRRDRLIGCVIENVLPFLDLK